jgi:hypothetical protein
MKFISQFFITIKISVFIIRKSQILGNMPPELKIDLETSAGKYITVQWSPAYNFPGLSSIKLCDLNSILSYQARSMLCHS